MPYFNTPDSRADVLETLVTCFAAGRDEARERITLAVLDPESYVAKFPDCVEKEWAVLYALAETLADRGALFQHDGTEDASELVAGLASILVPCGAPASLLQRFDGEEWDGCDADDATDAVVAALEEQGWLLVELGPFGLTLASAQHAEGLEAAERELDDGFTVHHPSPDEDDDDVDGDSSIDSDQQARMATLMEEFQAKVAKAQASGDFATLSTLTARFQQQMVELMGNGSAQAPLGFPSDEDEDDDAMPEDELCAWLMLLGAMYIEDNDMLAHLTSEIDDSDFEASPAEILASHFCALDMSMTGIDPDEVRKLLADSWSVSNAEELKNTLGWLLTEGHQQDFARHLEFCAKVPDPEQRTVAAYRARFDSPLALGDSDDEDLRDTLTLAEHLARKTPRGGIRAWDLARYVHLLRLAYLAGLVPSTECWARLLRLRKPALEEFDSWADFAQSYLAGLQLWSGTRGGTFEASCRRLLEHPRSPWRHFGWLRLDS